MKQILQQYAAYNYWANQQIMELVKALSAEQAHSVIFSSFSSIHKTIVHVRGAELAWYRRVHELSQDRSLFEWSDDTPSLCDEFLSHSAAWKKWVEELEEGKLHSKLTYKNFAGDEFTQPLYEILQHVFNHSTYHRGQLVTMLRQVGVEKIPSTDFIGFTRL